GCGSHQALPSFPTRRSSDLVVGEGAAGSKGSDAWSWNAKDASPVKAISGSGDPAVVVRMPAARSSDAAQAAADGLAAKAKLGGLDRKSTRLNSSHQIISYAV